MASLVCRYLAVVWIDLWRSIACTARMSQPMSSRCVALEWRSEWGERRRPRGSIFRAFIAWTKSSWTCRAVMGVSRRCPGKRYGERPACFGSSAR